MNIFQVADFNYKINAKQYNIDEKLFIRLNNLNPNLELLERDANKPIYQSTLERAQNNSEKKGFANIIESNGLMRLLIAAFLSTAQTACNSGTATAINKIQPVLKFIHDNLKDIITLENLAEVANLSPAYLSAIFSKTMGTSPIQYINKKKIESAQTLLLSSRLTLYEIAHLSGFNDEYYFSRMFTKIVGCPPGKYRKTHNQSCTK
ncbi:MAG: helix-turn-helix transcriptional regulator [Phycisphaerae bacterium]|nr:helix-turn-helix transcriptional regulator [Phycisphaerae bacterium]